MPLRSLLAVLAPLCALLALSTSVGAQDWNSQRALDLIERARGERRATHVDSSLTTYQGTARGFVYFFLDRPDADERTLIKADQVALEIYWKAPNRTKQVIVGLRDEKLLPTGIQYHLDHLTVVQDEFEDRIRLGDGDEVSDVTHPVAPRSGQVYDFQLSDSLTLALAGTQDTIRVYEVQVRPKDPNRPGFVGTVFLDRATAAIVRMSFTFTPASYVDPYLDYIRISLDNSLWLGRHWLPYRQEVELRREMPVLDFLAGSVIRGRFEIGDYDLNPELDDGLFQSRYVGALPVEQRRAFPFEESLFSHLDAEGLTTPPSIEAVEAQAREMVQERYLSGVRRLRLYLPSASSAYRYNRAEGNFLGVGTTVRSLGGWAVRVYGAYAFGRERASGRLSLFSPSQGGSAASVDVFSQSLRDIGPIPGASGVVNTLSGWVGETDWTDPYFASGARVRLPPLAPWLGVTLGWEHHDDAQLVVSDEGGSFRPVRRVEENDLAAIEISSTLGEGSVPESGWGAELRLMQGILGGFGVRRATVTAAWHRSDLRRNTELQVRLDGGYASSTRPDVPPQFLFLLGGRETLLGHPYRTAVGNVFWLLRVQASRRLASPWLTGRVFAGAGQAELRSGNLPPTWQDLEPAAGVRFTAGAGLGLFWDVVHLDLGHGLNGGAWDFAISVSHRLRAWL